jgi:catechol 2,3-dioxygenase-like lactoylglutathione lyase family enzyme
MIDHIGFAVSDVERSKAFYVNALKPLGLSVIAEVSAEDTGGDAHAGFGKDNKAFFWIGGGAKPKGGTHVAFAAPTRADVDSFYRAAYRAALAAGGLDNGPPGLRPHYAAFVFDPDGNNIEAACRQPE